MSEKAADVINADADRALRVAVERVVRPIVATETRKLKMRRELYAHAVEAYADETIRQADPAAAAARAASRLGEPSELTAELQAGVSMTNRREAAIDRWVRRDPATPPLRHTAIIAATTALGLFVFMLTVLGFCEALDLGKGADQLAIQFGAVLSVWFGAGVGVAGWFGGKIRDLLSDRGFTVGSVLRVALLCVGGFLVLLATGFGVLAILFVNNHGWAAPLMAMAELPSQFHLSWTALCAVVALAAAPIAWLDVRERAGLEEWLELDLG